MGNKDYGEILCKIARATEVAEMQLEQDVDTLCKSNPDGRQALSMAIVLSMKLAQMTLCGLLARKVAGMYEEATRSV